MRQRVNKDVELLVLNPEEYQATGMTGHPTLSTHGWQIGASCQKETLVPLHVSVHHSA